MCQGAGGEQSRLLYPGSDFPGGLMVKILCFQHRKPGCLIPYLGN